MNSTTTIELNSFRVFPSSGFGAGVQDHRFHTVHTATAKRPGHSCLIYMLRDKSHLKHDVRGRGAVTLISVIETAAGLLVREDASGSQLVDPNCDPVYLINYFGVLG